MSGNYNCHLYILPFILIVLLIWSYYLYVVAFLGHVKEDPVLIYIFLLIFNILYIFLIWSLLCVIFTPRDQIPEQYKLTPAEIEIYNGYNQEQKRQYLTDLCNNKKITVMTRTSQGTIRYCRICKHLKPDRAHHCSHCRRCILKMDHHCPWFAVCIGLTNQKSFNLTLLYSIIYCGFYVATSVTYFMEYFQHVEDHHDSMPTVIGFIISACLGVVSIIIWAYQIKIILKNETSLELIQETKFVNGRYTFNIGWRQNFTEVFGGKWFHWLIPTTTFKGTGLVFPTRELPPEVIPTRVAAAIRPTVILDHPREVNSREMFINAMLRDS